MKRLTLFISFWVSFNFILLGQYFESLNDFHPIPRVNCIYQDTFGFIWFGTRGGLVKYDGVSPSFFQKSTSDPFSLPGSDVTAIVQDSDSTLFLGLTANGLVKFNRNTERFYSYSLDDSLGTINVNHLFKDSKRNIWIGTNKGLFNYSKGDIEYFNQEDKKKHGLKNNRIVKIFEDVNKNIWIATQGGIHRYSYENDYIENPETNPGFPAENIFDINCDKANNIWISSISGNHTIYKWDLNNDAFIPDKRFEDKGRYQFIFDQDNTLWISSDMEGVLKYKDSNKIIFTPEYYHEHGLRSYFPQSIIQDKYQNIWLSADNLYKISGSNKYFKRITTEGFRVSGLFVDNSHVWYCSKHPMRYSFSTGKSELLEYHLNNNQKELTRMYHFEAIGDSLIYTSITDIFIWNRKKDSVTKINTNKNGAFRDFIIREDGKLLIADNSKSILIFDPTTNSLEDLEELKIIKKPNSVAKSNEGVQWWGTDSNGLFSYNPYSNELSHYSTENQDSSKSLSSLNINDVLCHSDGSTWVATKLGLNRIDPLTGHVSKDLLGPKNKYSFISSILEDDEGNLWMGTQHGLIFLNPTLNIVKNFTKNDGLLNNIFTPKACFKDSNGFLYFGGRQGIDYFHPNQINENLIPPDIYIKSLKVNGRDYLNNIAGENLKEITLTHDDKYFEIE